jgi:hypothetical protein
VHEARKSDAAPRAKWAARSDGATFDRSAFLTRMIYTIRVEISTNRKAATLRRGRTGVARAPHGFK